MKQDKKVYIKVFSTVFILGVLCYWFAYRPMHARIICKNKTVQHFVDNKSGDSSREQAEFIYKFCLRGEFGINE